MKQFFLLALALGFFFENSAQQQAPVSKSKTTLYANRLRVSDLIPGGIMWPRAPNSSSWDPTQPTVALEFDGSVKPCAGVADAGLWLGGVDSAGQLHTSCAAYNYVNNQYPFTAGPLSGDWPTDSLNAIRWDRFFKVDRVGLETHRADWADNGVLDNPLPAIVGWPGRGNPHFENQYGFPLPDGELAPFVDANGDSIYNAFDGDYPHPPSLDPDILAGEIIWNVFNDAYGRFTDKPLGVEIHTTAWALACDGNNLLNETVFFSYRIMNRSGMDLDSVMMALWMVRELGYSFDDGWGTFLPANGVFTYNEDNLDINPQPSSSYPEGHFGSNPPVVTFSYLTDSLSSSISYIDGGWCDPPFGQLKPQTPIQYYRYLNGYWRDGTPLIYGNSGYNPNGGVQTKYAFPDDPNDPSGWSTLNSILFSWGSCIKIIPSIAIGFFPADTVVTVETALAYHRDTGLNNLQNVTYAYDRMLQLQQLYDSKFAGTCTYTTDFCTDDCVWPGDFDRDGIVGIRDLLPLGVGWKTQGLKRPGLITWAPHTAPDWDISFNNEYDYKHLDGNGDGLVDSVDFNIMSLFEGSTVPGYTAPPDTYPVGGGLWTTQIYPDIDPDNIQTDDILFLRTRVANALELYGLAFDVEFDTAYWKSYATTYPSASPGMRLFRDKPGNIKMATVFTDSTKSFPPNHIVFQTRLRAKAISDSLPDTTFVHLKNIKGIRADGSEIPMGANRLRYCFGGGCPAYVGTQELHRENISVYPNPSTDRVTLFAPDLAWENIETIDTNGRLLRRWDTPGSEQIELELADFPAGWLLLRVTGKDWVGQQKVLLLK